MVVGNSNASKFLQNTLLDVIRSVNSELSRERVSSCRMNECGGRPIIASGGIKLQSPLTKRQNSQKVPTLHLSKREVEDCRLIPVYQIKSEDKAS